MILIDLLLVIHFFPAVELIGVEFTCPTFKDGQNIVSCKINRTAIEAADCESLQENVSLEKTLPSRRNPLVIGFTGRFNLSNCKPIQEPVADVCWCDQANGEIFEYKCAFVANRSKDIDALLECKLCFFPKNSLQENINDNCLRMRFDSDGGSGGGTESGGGLNVGLIVGVIIGVVVLIVIIALIVSQRHRYQKYSDSACLKSRPEGLEIS